MIFSVRDNFNSKKTRELARCGHVHSQIPKVRPLQIALVLLGSFLAAELIAAVSSGSLSLLADAGHIFSDVAALGITLAATLYSSWKNRNSQRSENYNCTVDRPFDLPGTIAALINSISLVAIALWIAAESIARLQSPTPEIDGFPMLITAVVGLSVNSINAFCLHSCCHGDINLKSAFLHAIADICSSIGVIIAAIAVAWLHWNWADGLISLLVSTSIVLLTLPLLIESLKLLVGKTSAAPAIQQPCDCQKIGAEKLLFPSLEELIK